MGAICVSDACCVSACACERVGLYCVYQAVVVCQLNLVLLVSGHVLAIHVFEVSVCRMWTVCQFGEKVYAVVCQLGGVPRKTRLGS